MRIYAIKRAFLEAISVLMLALLPAIIFGLFQPYDSRMAVADRFDVTVEDLKTWNGAILWVDARSFSVYQRGHIPNALLLNEDSWNEHLQSLLDRWEPNVSVIVYCDQVYCDASHNIAARLRNEVGLADVYVLKGGWEAWQQRR